MRKTFIAALFVLLLGAGLVWVPAARAASSPEVRVESQYIVTTYGYAVINESVTYVNNGTSAVSVPTLQIGFGNISGMVRDYSVTGAGFSVAQQASGGQTVFAVSNQGATLGPGNSTSFSFMAPVEGVTTNTGPTTNETLWVLTLAKPSFNLPLASLKLQVTMPLSTEFKKNPSGLRAPVSTENNTYSIGLTNVLAAAPVTQLLNIIPSSSEVFNPVVVYYATRTISMSSSGVPTVQDTVSFENIGTTKLANLVVEPLTSPTGAVTVEPSAQPPLISPTVVALTNNEISLNNTNIALPVEPRQNLTITYQYQLAGQYYSISGGTVTVKIPNTPPIPAFVGTYTVDFSLPPGVKVTEAAPAPLAGANPYSSGTIDLSYSLSAGWALDSGVPLASLLFVVCLVGLFAVRTEEVGEEEEEEEESGSERAAAMIAAFEEKTAIINSTFDEIKTAEQAEMNKEFFVERRSRLDTFRAKALQRMNEVKQKSPNKRFFDLLNQITETDREIDRASKDLLNLEEQFRTSRMREEVYDRLQPNYKKRLDRALNQLSDELNAAQREAKLL